MTELPKAADMRRMLDDATTAQAEGQLLGLSQKIKSAVGNGQSSIQVDKLAPGVEAKLTAAGYKLKHYSGDQRDPAYWTVSW